METVADWRLDPKCLLLTTTRMEVNGSSQVVAPHSNNIIEYFHPSLQRLSHRGIAGVLSNFCHRTPVMLMDR